MSKAYPHTPDMKKEWSKKMAKHDERTYKGFKIKRDKPTKKGTGFTMMIHKKIKGFEEGADMSKIDEAEGIKTVSTKGYSGSKPKNPKYRTLTKGYINWKGGQPAGDADKEVLAWHKGEAAKAGKVVQLRYRGPRHKVGEPWSGVGPQQAHTTKGAGTGAAIYYKDKWQLGGRQRAKHWGWDKRNEDYEMEDGKYEVIYENENEVENEIENQEVQGPDVSDLVMNAIEQRPLEFQQSFSDLMQQRIEDAVAEKKLEIANIFVNGEPSQYTAGEEEPAEDENEEEEGEVEEEPEVQEEE